jgi:hypothetical protein
MVKSNIMGYKVHAEIEEDFDIPCEKQAEFIKQFGDFCVREELYYTETFIQPYRDSNKVNIHVIWDLTDFNNDIYNIRKHIKEVSYQTIHRDFIDTFDKYLMHAYPVISTENDLNPFKFKPMSWYGKRLDEFNPYIPILVYRDSRVEPALDFLNKIPNTAIQDYCLGLILGYSVADMGRYVTTMAEYQNIKKNNLKK